MNHFPKYLIGKFLIIKIYFQHFKRNFMSGFNIYLTTCMCKISIPEKFYKMTSTKS